MRRACSQLVLKKKISVSLIIYHRSYRTCSYLNEVNILPWIWNTTKTAIFLTVAKQIRPYWHVHYRIPNDSLVLCTNVSPITEPDHPWTFTKLCINVHRFNNLETIEATKLKITMDFQGSKLGWTGGPSLPKIPSDHRYACWGCPVVYQKMLAFLLHLLWLWTLQTIFVM